MKGWVRPGAAALLVVLVTAWVLAGVALNRRPPAEATVTLTEREAHLDWQEKEDTGISLSIVWSYGGSDDAEVGLEEARLLKVGFEFPVALDDPRAETRYRDLLPRRAYAVLELEGDAWQTHLARQTRELEKLREKIRLGEDSPDSEQRLLRAQADNRLNGSRLFLIDAGRDAAALRRDHPDRSRFIIVPALFHAEYQKSDWVNGKIVFRTRVVGTADLLNPSFHVSRSRRAILDQVRSEDEARRLKEKEIDTPSTRPPAYQVVLRFGRRLEPWVERIDRLPAGGAPQ